MNDVMQIWIPPPPLLHSYALSHRIYIDQYDQIYYFEKLVFTKTITTKFAMLKKLTCIAYCSVAILAIFVMCMYFARGQIVLFFQLKKTNNNLDILSYLDTLP